MNGKRVCHPTGRKLPCAEQLPDYQRDHSPATEIAGVLRNDPALLALAERRLTVHQLARLLGKHPSTIARWFLKGVRGHILRSHLIGGRRHIDLSDLEDFLAAINGDRNAMPGAKARNAEKQAVVERQLDQVFGASKGQDKERRR